MARAKNKDVGARRAPSGFALFCSAAAAEGIGAVRRRLRRKTPCKSKTAILHKWCGAQETSRQQTARGGGGLGGTPQASKTRCPLPLQGDCPQHCCPQSARSGKCHPSNSGCLDTCQPGQPHGDDQDEPP